MKNRARVGVTKATALLLSLVPVALSLDLNQGPGGPILVITSSSFRYGTYYAEILRTEGLNEFTVADIATLNQPVPSTYDVVILAPAALTAAQVTNLSAWVNGGGNLIAMKPDPQLASLVGVTSTGSTLSNGYLKIYTSTAYGNGIVGQPIQFHDTANVYTLNGATTVAALYTNVTTATSNPAVTIKTVGSSGGHASAFAYDLATSIVYTRQGNPAWAAQERDGVSPIRSDDKFYGNAGGDPEPDWVDLDNEVSIPQADEQQRLLANLITQMNLTRKPLPRFWYFPNGKKAVVIMTGDDHGNGGTAGRFDQFMGASQPGCSVANWECIRSTSYIYVETGNLTPAQAATYTANGFEVGLHINTDCTDFTSASLDTTYSQEVSNFTSSYPTIPAPITQRHHCIVWSDWLTAAKMQLKYGMRLDTSYYFWPPAWVEDRPGHFTGSAMPMRFADLDGRIIDVYNATTQMTDESGQSYPATSDALLSAAVGPQGYYGAFTVNAHTDSASNPVSDAVLSSALSRQVPIVSSVQMLRWLDARNSSSFGGFTWSANTLNFTITPGSGANGLQAMLPARSSAGTLANLTRTGGGSVPFTVDTIKGMQYAFFSAAADTYTATYAVDTTLPTVVSTSPVSGTTDVDLAVAVAATFSEAIDPTTINTTTFSLRDANNNAALAAVSYSAATNTAMLTPPNSLAALTKYTATLTTGVKDLSGNPLAANYIWSFTTAAGPTCPCSAWSSSATPSNASVNDPNAVELGVKFKVDLNGFISGIRFYKGTSNTGTHVGNLWSTSGQLLATATFTNETALGWQQVNFSNPVAVMANTVYVASYHTNTGNYAGDNGYFANSGVDNVPVHLLEDGVSGGNGVYAYGASSAFPASTWQSSNYWVDVVFTMGSGLYVTATTPASGATGVNPGATIGATFSNALDASTITAATFTLKDSGGTRVTGAFSVSGNTATFTPGSPLAAATSYTATLTTGIKDINNNALGVPYTWSFTTTGPEAVGWVAGDMHVHRSCGGSPEVVSSMYNDMAPQNLAAISLLADMGNGEVQNPTTDLPLVNGQDASVSTPGRILHWDAEWHWDATYTQYPHQALGGHIVALGLSSAQQIWQEYTYPILNWAHQQGGIAGFAHLQYLDGNNPPQTLTCCTPIEYPVEVALGTADFISEDVDNSGAGAGGMNPENFIQAYYKLLNSGFRPGFAAGTDYPCNSGRPLGTLLTYVQVPGGQMTYRNWITGIKSGRTVVSRNGHNEFLNLTVNGNNTPGDEVDLAQGGSVPVTVQWTATQNLSGTIELVSNGVVVASTSASVAPGAPVNWNPTVNFPKSGWIAARRMGTDGHQVHTAAVFVIVNGAPIRASAADAQYFVDWMTNLLANTSPGGVWNHFFPTSLSAAQARYQAAMTKFQQIAAEASGASSTSTTVSSSQSTSGFGQSVTFTASVAPIPPATGTPSGSVTFNDGTGILGTAVLSGGTASISSATLTVGSHSITAAYAGDSNFSPSTSAVLTQTVNLGSTTTAVSSSSNPSVTGQGVTLIATLTAMAPATGTPTGSVTFKDGTGTLGTAVLNGGTASISSATLTVGSHSITAVYAGDGNFSGSTSAALLQTVNLGSSTTAVSSSQNPSVSGQSVIFTAAVTATPPATGAPTGSVTFQDGSTVLGTGTLSSGKATLSTSLVIVGSHTITAVYGGDTSFSGSTSPALTQTVNTASSTTTVTSSLNPSGVGQTVTFTASVTAAPPGTGTPTGTVTFKDGSNILGTGTISSGKATLSTSALAVGSHSITATYGGDGNFSGSTSLVLTQTVNAAASATAVASSLSPAVFGQSVMFTAIVTAVAPATGTPTGSVTFKDGTATLGTGALTGGTASFSTSTLGAGSHSITAVYGGDGNFAGSTSAALTQSVNKASSTTAVVSSQNPAMFGQSAKFTATVAPVSPGAGTPTGSVTFKDGTATLGTGTLSGGVATFSTSALAVSTHSITAVYGGDANFLGSPSPALTQTVNQASTSISLTSSKNPSKAGQSVTFTATVTAVSPGAGTPSGSVTFKDGTATVGTATLSRGIATFKTSTLSKGNHSITAVYAGDSSFTGNTSGVLTEIIQ